MPNFLERVLSWRRPAVISDGGLAKPQDKNAAIGPPIYRLADVFRAGAYEVNNTYVPRPYAEAAVRDQLRHENAIILFSGPSKSGKTVLCHRYSTDHPCAHLHAYQAMSGDEFWEALRQSIEAPEGTELTTHRERILETERKCRVGIGVSGYGGQLDVGADWDNREKVTDLEERKVSIPSPGRPGVINFLKSNPHTIIVDDYHWESRDRASGLPAA